jgi:hypothetical protein
MNRSSSSTWKKEYTYDDEVINKLNHPKERPLLPDRRRASDPPKLSSSSYLTINEKEPAESSHTRYFISKDSKLARDIDHAKMLASSALDRLINRGENMSELKGTKDSQYMNMFL